MDSKTLFILTLFILVGSNLITLLIASKYYDGDDPLPTSLYKAKPPSNYFSFKYGHESIPKAKRTSLQTVHSYLKEKGLPTYDLGRNYGDFEKIKQYEAHQALNSGGKELLDTGNPRREMLGLLDGGDSGPTADIGDPDLQKQLDDYKREIQILKQQLAQLTQDSGDDGQTSTSTTQAASAATDAKNMENMLKNNPYRKLGVYETMPTRHYNNGPNSKLYKDTRYYGIIPNPHYCEQVDLYNLIHPQNAFENMKFVSDYCGDEILLRSDVMPIYGDDLLPDMAALMPTETYSQDLWYLPLNATAFIFKRINVHHFYEANKQMVCLSQIYNHIPGHGVLTRKDLVSDSVTNYTKKYSKRPQCLQNSYFPPVYRLNVEDECKAFFAEFNSQEYQDRKENEPVQYILKVGYGVHRAAGIALFLDEEEKKLNDRFESGELCGKHNDSLLVQKYISNPLLLDRQNKFDFRIYMLITSVKPLIVYYHDGFLRLSLSKYDKHSKEKNVHFTNTHLSKPIFKEAAKQKEYEGMTEDELREYQMWLMTDLQDYLLEQGVIKDPNWLENQVIPKFKEAFIHIARMSEHAFYKSSSVFELFGLDFVMDENLNIWFIECNASPQLIGTSERKTEFLKKMLTDMLELQVAYYRSRMRKIYNFMQRMISQIDENPDQVDYDQLKEEFDHVNTNDLDPSFPISEDNGFIRILDKNLEGHAAYFGNLDDNCIDFDDDDNDVASLGDDFIST